MEENLKHIQLFFKLNLEIKQLLDNNFPKLEDNYNTETKIQYLDKLLKNTQKIKDDFLKIIKIFPIGITEKYIHNFFNYIENKIVNFNYKKDNLWKLYQYCFTDINPKLVDETNEICIGYFLLKSIDSLITKCTTVNELLHIIHSYIINDENIYQKIPILEQKETIGGYPISLRGLDNTFWKNLFEAFPLTSNCGYTDIVIVSPNHAIMMIRDLGHATTIEMKIENDIVSVNYFIPKICNLEMVKKLKGIDNPKEGVNWITGQFCTNIQDFQNELFNLLKGIPTDNDMEIIQKYYR